LRIAVPGEVADERRVAITPQVARRLGTVGHQVVVAEGIGGTTGFADATYVAGGAEVEADPLQRADLTVVVGPPPAELARRLPEGSALAGFLDPFASVDLVAALVERRITAFAAEALPRTTLAQSMDALSSQAAAAGYQAVLVAAAAAPRIFPMMITAAGTIAPVKVLVLGAGVAGLQAVATANRLGAVVSAYDIRPQVREQIESLGAKFIAAPVDESAAAATGYARELADDTQRRQQDALASFVADADVVITTAQIPGRPAPLLVSREMVETMQPGSIIVDVAAASGGNCELTRPDDEVVHAGVRIIGPTDLAGMVAVDASEMYARNLTAFIERITGDDGSLSLDFDDEIVAAACITHAGQVLHPVTRRVLGMGSDRPTPGDDP